MPGRSAAAGPAVADLALEPAEVEILAAEATEFASAVRDADAQARYLRLASVAAAGAVPAELVPALETMLELLFQKRRPANRAVLQAVFARTPRGRHQRATANEVNTALRALRGQRLDELRLSPGPGGHTLVIATEACRLTLELDSASASVASLEIG